MPDEDIDFTKLKVAELKEELKKRGLNTEGKKNELIERLQLNVGDSALLDDTHDHDDILDDDVLSEDDVLNDPSIDTPLEPIAKAQKRRSDSHDDDEVKRNTKKVILNRNVVPDPPAVVETETITETEESKNVTSNAQQPGPAIKVSALTQKERLERRAARFGSATAMDTSKVTTSQPRPLMSAATSTAKAPSTDLELLKKRAERFGTVAPILEKAELDERRRKRMERFGGAQLSTTEAGTLSSSNGSSTDKKTLRAQKFQSS